MNAERADLDREIVERILELLAPAPQAVEGLTFAIDVDGFFRALEETGVGGLDSESGKQDYLRDLMLLSGEIWADEDDPEGLNHRCDQLFEGRVLTHRLTEREVREGLLVSQPETVGHDFGISPDDHPFGALVEQNYDAAMREVSWRGPEDWFAAQNPGDLISIRRIGGAFVIASIAPWELGNGRAEIAALTSFADTLTPNVAYDDFDLLPKVFAEDPTVFRAPTLPLSELLGRAGLEIRDGYYGLAREPWSPPGELHQELDLDDLVARFGLDECCRAALDSLISSWIDLRVKPTDAAVLDYRAMAEQLSHGPVALAFEAWTIPMGSLDADPYIDVLVSMAAIAMPSAAGAHFLLARSLLRRGEVLSAVRALERSLESDRGYWPADVEMASIDFYLGNYERARNRLERSGGGQQGLVADLFPDDTTLDSIVVDTPRRSMMAKAQWYLRSDACRSQMTMARVLAFGSSANARTDAADRFVSDLVLFEGGLFARFLGAHYPLFSPDELVEAELLRGSMRELFEVVGLRDDGRLELRGVALSGVTTTLEPHRADDHRIGQHLLARVVSGAAGDVIDGSVFAVDARQRRALIDVLTFAREEPSAALRELLDWFATAHAAPPLDEI